MAIIKGFVPPVEKPSLDGTTVALICHNIRLLNDPKRFEDNKTAAVELLKDTERLSMLGAHDIGCGDWLVRLRKNALALITVQNLVQLTIENMVEEQNEILRAIQKEHELYLANVEKMRKAWIAENRKERDKERKAQKKGKTS